MEQSWVVRSGLLDQRGLALFWLPAITTKMSTTPFSVLSLICGPLVENRPNMEALLSATTTKNDVVFHLDGFKKVLSLPSFRIDLGTPFVISRYRTSC